MNVVIVPATLEAAFVLATTMREKDVAEMDRCGLTPLEGLLKAMGASEVACAALYDDVVGAMFGVTRSRTLWLLTGHLFAQKPLAFAREAKRVLGIFTDAFGPLSNYIDAKHDDALRFATMLAEQTGWIAFGSPTQLGPKRELFIPFTIGGI